jgi:hypothetical protein
LVTVSAHVVAGITRTARDEASDDLGRLVAGLAVFGIGFILCGHAMLLLHCLAVAGLLAWGVSLVQAFAWLLGIDVAIALACTLIGRAILRRPILVETRKRLEDLERAYEIFAS